MFNLKSCLGIMGKSGILPENARISLVFVNSISSAMIERLHLLVIARHNFHLHIHLSQIVRDHYV